MKRLSLTILALMIALTLASCTSEPSATTAVRTTAAAPSPTTAAPTTTASPATTAIATANPSSYVITNFEGVKVTLALPIGWAGYGLYVNNGGDPATTLTGIEIWSVEQPYTDPCHWQETELVPPLGPTVDDLATALQNQLTRGATTGDVTLDGYSGKLVKMTVPADVVLADCDGDKFRSWVWGSDASRWA